MMKERLLQLIAFKTNGNKTEFATLMGWSPQYLQNLLAGRSLGLTPILTILDRCRDINARWLLLGDGEMFDPACFLNTLTLASRRALTMTDMDDSTRRNFIAAIANLNDSL